MGRCNLMGRFNLMLRGNITGDVQFYGEVKLN